MSDIGGRRLDSLDEEANDQLESLDDLDLDFVDDDTLDVDNMHGIIQVHILFTYCPRTYTQYFSVNPAIPYRVNDSDRNRGYMPRRRIYVHQLSRARLSQQIHKLLSPQQLAYVLIPLEQGWEFAKSFIHSFAHFAQIK